MEKMNKNTTPEWLKWSVPINNNIGSNIIMWAHGWKQDIDNWYCQEALGNSVFSQMSVSGIWIILSFLQRNFSIVKTFKDVYTSTVNLVTSLRKIIREAEKRLSI